MLIGTNLTMCEPEAELDYIGIGDLCLHLPLLREISGVFFSINIYQMWILFEKEVKKKPKVWIYVGL